MQFKIAMVFLGVAVLIAAGTGIYAGRKGLERQECQNDLTTLKSMLPWDVGYNVYKGAVTDCYAEGKL